MPGFHAGRPPRNKGVRYPADHLIVVLWRAGLRIQEALALAEADLDHRRGALLGRRGKGGRRREVGMDTRGWDELQPWLELRIGQTGHSNLGITSVYLQGIDNAEIIDTVHTRRAPMIPVEHIAPALTDPAPLIARGSTSDRRSPAHGNSTFVRARPATASVGHATSRWAHGPSLGDRCICMRLRLSGLCAVFCLALLSSVVTVTPALAVPPVITAVGQQDRHPTVSLSAPRADSVTVSIASKPGRATDGSFLQENVVEYGFLTDSEIQSGLWLDSSRLTPARTS